MDKKEFLAVLRESLEGYIPSEEVEKNIIFYQEYFRDSEKSEKTLIQELGEPRLIARTIIDAYKASKGPMADYYTEQARSEYSKAHSEVYEEEAKAEKAERMRQNIIRGLVAAGVILLFLFILFFVGSIVISFLPVIVIVVVILILLGVFQD